MTTFIVVRMHIFPNSLPCFSDIVILSQICFLIFETPELFSFSEYGYQNVNCSSVLSILRNLEYRLDGYLSVQYKDYAVYDPSVTVTHGTMPGGSDGYYVNVGSYDTGHMPTYAYLYLGEMARQKRSEGKKKGSIFK